MTLVGESGDLDFNLVARPGRLISLDIFPPPQREGAGHRGDLWAGNQAEKKLSMAHGGQKRMESSALPRSDSIRYGVKISGDTEVVRNCTNTQTHHQCPISTGGSEQGSQAISMLWLLEKLLVRAAPTLPSPKWMNEALLPSPVRWPQAKASLWNTQPGSKMFHQLAVLSFHLTHWKSETQEGWALKEEAKLFPSQLITMTDWASTKRKKTTRQELRTHFRAELPSAPFRRHRGPSRNSAQTDKLGSAGFQNVFTWYQAAPALSVNHGNIRDSQVQSKRPIMYPSNQGPIYSCLSLDINASKLCFKRYG